MTVKIKILKSAKYDIQNAVDWYSKQQPGLENKFISEVNTVFDILKTVNSFSVRYSDVRCVPLKKFPFMVHYKIKGKTILVYAVIHTSKNPTNYWVLNA